MAADCQGSVVKGFKVTDVSRRRLIGVACSSLLELKRKACQKLQISANLKNVEVVLCDGTFVDDDSYFQTLPSQTILVLRKPGEKVVDGVDIIYGALKSFNAELLETPSLVRQFLDDDARTKIQLLSQFLQKDADSKKALLSTKSEDPEWFEDLETIVNTKEEYMRRRSSGRIQRYFYDAKDKIRQSYFYLNSVPARRLFDDGFNNFYQRLRRDRFFGEYFDRTACGDGGAICNGDGLFVCEGLWNSDCCSYTPSDHRINPYVSKEQRIVFATWNLDHRIERSRTIIPSMVKASEVCCRDSNSVINWGYFYDLFFSRQNLKLVHIVCHDKNEHKTAVCDAKKIIIRDSENVVIKRQTVNAREKYTNCLQYKRQKRIIPRKN